MRKIGRVPSPKIWELKLLICDGFQLDKIMLDAENGIGVLRIFRKHLL